MQIDRVSTAQKRVVKGSTAPLMQPVLVQKDVIEKSRQDRTNYCNDPLKGQGPSGTIQFTELEQGRVFTLFMAIDALGKSFRAQSNISVNMMNLSTIMTEKIEGYLTRQVAQQKIQAEIVAKYNATHPTWLKYMEQAVMLVGSIAMGMMTGGLAGALIVAAIGIGVDAADDVKLDKKGKPTKNGEYTVWDLMFKNVKSPTAKAFAKLGFILAVSLFAGLGTGLAASADELTAEALNLAGRNLEEEGDLALNDFFSEDNPVLKDTTAINNRAKTRGFLVALDAFSRVMSSVRTRDVQEGKMSNDTFSFFGDLALGAGSKHATTWDTWLSFGTSVALMIVQFGGTYFINKTSEVVKNGEWMQRIFSATSYIDGAAMAISSGAQAVNYGISAYYANELATISKNLTELEKSGALVEVLKQSVNGATKSSMQQMQGIMDAIIAAIEGYSTQLSQGV